MHTHEELIQICTIDVLSIELNLLAGILGNINDNINDCSRAVYSTWECCPFLSAARGQLCCSKWVGGQWPLSTHRCRRLVPSSFPCDLRVRSAFVPLIRPFLLGVVGRSRRLLRVHLPPVRRAVRGLRGVLHRGDPRIAQEPDDPVDFPSRGEVEVPRLEGLRSQPRQPRTSE